MSLPDRAGWRVVLVGTATYAHLDDLPAVHGNLSDLEALLTDGDVGAVPQGQCAVVEDPATPQEVYQAVKQAAELADDVLLVYFSGHGLLDPDTMDTLYLALTGADPDDLTYTALPVDHLLRAVRRSPARTRVVVLDCCYSGRALADTMSASPVEHLDISGSCLITATPANRQAYAPAGASHTAFTGVLIEVLRHGVPGCPQVLTLGDVYRRTKQLCAGRALPDPQSYAINTAERLPLALNRAGLAPARPQVRAAPLVIKGRHALEWPGWMRLPANLSLLYVGASTFAYTQLKIVAGWAVTGALLALLYVIYLMTVPRWGSYTIQVDRWGLAMRYGLRRPFQLGWDEIARVELSDGELRAGLVPEARPPRRGFRWSLHRVDGDSVVLAALDEVDRRPREIAESFEAHAGQAWDPASFDTAAEAAVLPTDRVRIALGVLAVLAIGLPLGLIMTGAAGLSAAAAYAILAVAAVLVLWHVRRWLLRPGHLTLDAQGLAVSLGGRSLALGWAQVEWVALTDVPGRLGARLVTVRPKPHARLPRLPRYGLAGPWRTRDGTLVLCPSWAVAGRGEDLEESLATFGGARWRAGFQPWDRVRETMAETRIPFRLTWPRVVLLSGAAVVVGALPLEGVPFAVVLCALVLMAAACYVTGDPGELRVDGWGVRGRFLGLELVSVPWTAIAAAEVSGEEEPALLLRVKGRPRALWPLARGELRGVRVLAVSGRHGHLGATAEELERALDRYRP
ncbi:caspase family protein [Nonomuraea mangrovi]|uniref:Caspase family protein n=1 Tax=Nonomuraea mangrovi TaxID=2316207 RepID=A0ABW4TFK2_9ACTN